MAPGGRESRTEGRRGESAGAATDPTSERQGADQSRLHNASAANGSFCAPCRQGRGERGRTGESTPRGAGAMPSTGTGHEMAQ